MAQRAYFKGRFIRKNRELIRVASWPTISAHHCQLLSLQQRNAKPLLDNIITFGNEQFMAEHKRNEFISANVLFTCTRFDGNYRFLQEFC